MWEGSGPTTKKKVGLARAVLLLAGFLATPAHARLRAYYEDAVVVERSEVILVGRLKKGSIEYVPHKRKPHEGRSWEHHAVLVVGQVLKGTLDEREIPIIIHYGLDPVVGGYLKRDGFMTDLRGGRKDYPKDIIEILDTGSSARRGEPLVGDAGSDNLWFLRRRSGIYGRKPGTGNFGIVDPQDVQPLALKDYFLAYLSEDPEKAVKEYVAKNPELAKRAESYFDHLEIQRILKIADPRARVERLLPYYAKPHRWKHKPEAEEGIVACGDMAGPYLLQMFHDPAHRKRRTSVMQTWAKLRYEGCVDVLVGLLRKHDEFWAKQELRSGWWNRDVDSELARQRRETYGEVFNAVVALERIGDSRAREAIELTKRRWEGINFSNPQIVKWCEKALRTFSESDP